MRKINKSLKKETEETYDKLAQEYHKKRITDRDFNELLEIPITLDFLGELKNQKILDTGCGTGILSKILSDNGAKVTGIDISEKMIDIAKDYCKGLGIKFDVGSVDDLPYDNSSFDKIVSSLVIHYFEDADKVFKEFNRVLKKGGILVFSTNHPVNSCIDDFTEYKNKPAMIVSDYFTRRKFYWSSRKLGDTKIPSFHFTFEDIIDYILNNGFQIEDFKETKLSERDKEVTGEEKYNKWRYLPTFVVFKCRKK